MSKATTLNAAATFSKIMQGKGKKVGLVVGSFDILHLGHTNLFYFAKKYIDYLIVGLDNDKTIKLVKGKNRPINNYKRRSELLSALETVDKVFEIRRISHHDSEEALNNYRTIVIRISPTHIFTHKLCDNHWENKQKIAKEMKIKFLFDKSKKVTNSGTIIKLISAEL